MDTRGQRQIAASIALGTHLPVTSVLRPEEQLLLLYSGTNVDSSSPFGLQSVGLAWSYSS